MLNVKDIIRWDNDSSNWITKVKPLLKHKPKVQPDNDINKMISVLEYADICKINVDAIVNRCYDSLGDGGSLYNDIIRNSGKDLEDYILTQKCEKGSVLVTKGYKLPCKHIIHTLGPSNEDMEEYEDILESLFKTIDGKEIKSIALTPFYVEHNALSFDTGTQMLLNFIRKYLEIPENREKVDRIIFVLPLESHIKPFIRLLYLYFPSQVTIPAQETAEYDLEESESSPDAGYEEEDDKPGSSDVSAPEPVLHEP